MNPHRLTPTAPSRPRVYQFHHLGLSVPCAPVLYHLLGMVALAFKPGSRPALNTTTGRLPNPYNRPMFSEPERKQVSLRVYDNEPTVRMAEQRLQIEGIPCLVRSLRGGPGLWGTAYNLPHDLLVYDGDEPRAREVLQFVPRDEREPYLEGEEPSPLMPQWMVTATIVAIVAFIAFTVVIANRAIG